MTWHSLIGQDNYGLCPRNHTECFPHWQQKFHGQNFRKILIEASAKLFVLLSLSLSVQIFIKFCPERGILKKQSRWIRLWTRWVLIGSAKEPAKSSIQLVMISTYVRFLSQSLFFPPLICSLSCFLYYQVLIFECGYWLICLISRFG